MAGYFLALRPPTWHNSSSPRVDCFSVLIRILIGKVVAMARSWCGLWPFPVLVASLLVLGGCNQGAGPGVGSHPIKDIMTKLNKGPQSLTPLIGAALKAESPAWETVQGQTQEVVRLATAVGQNDPPKGDKDSWQKMTAAYVESATALDKAAQAKDRDAAVAAHDKLSRSCMGCHREHR
jgi:hypothetical protein